MLINIGYQGKLKAGSWVMIAAVMILFPISILHAQDFGVVTDKDIYPADIMTGAERTGLYFPLITGKNIAVVVNQTATIGKMNLVDSLIKAGMKIKKVFCPEHGFRGQEEAGEVIVNAIDKATGLPVISLYGKNNKPRAGDLKDVDIVIFDIQDVGVRFYTYISTLHLVMEACAENKKTLIILDRPNPNGHYVDGPVLEKEYASFVGMDPVPLVHGMTMAEYACMLNGEGWLKKGIKCDLKYVTVFNYNHRYFYHLPIQPSPNLPNMEAIWLYPSLGLFEGTVVSVGRGTEKPFQQIGHPLLKDAPVQFTPNAIPGVSVNPLYKGKVCYGYSLHDFSEAYIKNSGKLYLFWLAQTYRDLKDSTNFFNSMFDKLAGTAKFRQQIINGISEDEIRKSWESDIAAFKKIRKKYILYPDFE